MNLYILSSVRCFMNKIKRTKLHEKLRTFNSKVLLFLRLINFVSQTVPCWVLKFEGIEPGKSLKNHLIWCLGKCENLVFRVQNLLFCPLVKCSNFNSHSTDYLLYFWLVSEANLLDTSLILKERRRKSNALSAFVGLINHQKIINYNLEKKV